MKKKFIIILVIVLLICIVTIIYIPIYNVDSNFTYEINKANRQVTITGYLADNKARERYNNGYDEELIFPETIKVPKRIKGYPVTSIGSEAFKWSKAKEVVLPDTIEKLEYSAFFHCEDLEILTGTENIVVLEDFALAGCKELQEVKLPKLKFIGESVFSGNEKMKEATFPQGIKAIPYASCMGMDALTKVEIPEGVESIDSRVFAFCNALEEIYIPPCVTDIHRGTFEGIEENVTIVGVKGSYAQEYASEMGITFREADSVRK